MLKDHIIKCFNFVFHYIVTYYVITVLSDTADYSFFSKKEPTLLTANSMMYNSMKFKICLLS